jgi:hypothetical protein
MELRGLEMAEIPDPRDRQGKVGIVRQKGLAILAFRDRPVVACGRRRRNRQVLMENQGGRVQWPDLQVTNRVEVFILGEEGPGMGRKEIFPPLAPHLGSCFDGQELLFVVGLQKPGVQGERTEEVLDGPRFRFKAGGAEFQGQVLSLELEVSIDPGQIGLHQIELFRGKSLGGPDP